MLGKGMTRDQAVQVLLELPDFELFTIRRAAQEPSPPAHIYPSVECAFCHEGVMEPRVRVKDGKFACLECAEA